MAGSHSSLWTPREQRGRINQCNKSTALLKAVKLAFCLQPAHHWNTVKRDCDLLMSRSPEFWSSTLAQTLQQKKKLRQKKEIMYWSCTCEKFTDRLETQVLNFNVIMFVTWALCTWCLQMSLKMPARDPVCESGATLQGFTENVTAFFKLSVLGEGGKFDIF